MERVIKLKRAEAAQDPGVAAHEPLRRKCAYVEAVGACLLLVIVAVTLL